MSNKVKVNWYIAREEATNELKAAQSDYAHNHNAVMTLQSGAVGLALIIGFFFGLMAGIGTLIVVGLGVHFQTNSVYKRSVAKLEQAEKRLSDIHDRIDEEENSLY